MIAIQSKSRLATRLLIAGGLLFGTFVATAGAEERHDDHHGRDRHEERGHDRGWNGGYYAPPPVVYAPPAYYPPPVVYGPSVGVYLPGISIGIR